jgi:hypothetical protein
MQAFFKNDFKIVDEYQTTICFRKQTDRQTATPAILVEYVQIAD